MLRGLVRVVNWEEGEGIGMEIGRDGVGGQRSGRNRWAVKGQRR